MRPFRVLLPAVASLCVLAASPAAVPAQDVTKVTLHNGLRVVIVRNALAPVVSTALNYLVGYRDDPPDVPGMAHANEHMMFRGTPDLSTAELGTIATALGGDFNARTSEVRTEYQFTIPAADLGYVLHIEADRMHGVLDSQTQWEHERGAIEQEVAHDDTAPGQDFFRDANAIAFRGTPYAHPGVGTKAAFDRLTGPEIKAFHDRWYAPNNAVLVIAGDVDVPATIAAVHAQFDAIPPKEIPAHEVAHLEPLKRTVIRRATTLAYPLAALGFRLPGSDSPDFIPAYVLQGVLDSPRGALNELADEGRVLDASWDAGSYFPEGQLSFATAALPPGDDPDDAVRELERIITDYQHHGVPSDLFAATKRRLITSQETSRNSISDLATDWAQTIALDGEPSIAREQELIGEVTLADVDRVAKKYLDVDHAIVGALTPSATANGNGPAAPATSTKENPLTAEPPVTKLPAWAAPLLADIQVPPSRLDPVTTKLPNGLTLIVQPETISDSVFVYGNVVTVPELQEPDGKEGVSRVLDEMFDEGTATLDRRAFRRAQDDIDSQIGGGPSFGAQTTSAQFEPAVELLAQNVLTPRIDGDALDLSKRRSIEQLETQQNSSHYVAQREAALKLLPFADPELRVPTVATLQGISLGDVRSYQALTMRPDLTTIVVIGNVTVARAQAEIAKTFGGWRAAGPTPHLTLPALPRNDAGEVKLAIPVAEDYVSLEQILPLGRTSPLYYPLLLGDAMLGGGSLGPEQSRLFRDIRQNAGLVYSIASQFVAHGERARFSIEFACDPKNTAHIEDLVRGEIAQLRTAPAGPFELALMKSSLVRSGIVDQSSVASIGGAFLDDASDGFPLDQGARDAQALLATDAPAVQAAFAAQILPDHFVTTTEGP